MREPDEHGSSLWRGLLGIVLVGAALGIGHNAMQKAAGPRHGLAWIKQEVKLASLESIAEAATTDSTTTDSTAANSIVSPNAPAATPDVAPHDASHRDASHAESAAHAAKPTTPGGKLATPHKGATASTTPSGAAAPATTPGSAPAPAPAQTAATVPTVPDTREPLEARYASIKRLADAGMVTFVDARSPEEYVAGHIAGAVNMPFDEVFKDPDKAKGLETHGRPIVVTYCGGGDCDLSRNLAFSLIDVGHKKVLVFLEGLPGWKDTGNAITTGATP